MRPWVAVVPGLAATGGTVIVVVVLLWSFALERCGGFFGESNAVPGTLSQDLCGGDAGKWLFWAAIAPPLLAGLAGSVRAGRSGRHRTWQWPLAAGTVVSAAAIAVLALSGEIR